MTPAESPPSATKRATIVAVTSGKGGVGKTFVAANMAAALARLGLRVLVLDADLGLANLDVALNLSPKVTLHDVFTGKCSLQEALVPAPGGFTVLLAGSGMVEYSRLTPEVRDQLLGVIDAVSPHYDFVLLDTGAGISDVVLFTVSLADEVMIVATPEPTSLTDAYATVKVLASTQARRAFWLLLSQTRRQGEARAVRSQLQLVLDRFLNPTLDAPVQLLLLGDVPSDLAVREAVQRRQLLLQTQPGSPAAQALMAAAERLIQA